jgi:glycosyltransferase involved in cell wall biosynthesis
MTGVSVIIPVFNGAATVEEAVESVLAQRFRDFELIVVNDGSTDDTSRVLEKFAGVLKIIDQPNSGPARARNAATRIATGEFLAFLDADDRWKPEMLFRTTAALESDPGCVLVYGNLELIESTGASLGASLIGPAMAHAPSLDEMMTVIWPIMPSGALIRRSAFDRCGGFCEEFTSASLEDAYLWYLLREQGHFYYLPETLGYWRFSMFPTRLKDGRANVAARHTFNRLLRERYGNAVKNPLKSRLRAPRSILGFIGLTAMRNGETARAREAFVSALRIDPFRLKNYLRLLRTYLPACAAAALSGRTRRPPS